MASYDLAITCPWCLRRNTQATDTTLDPRPPTLNDVAVCWECMGAAEFVGARWVKLDDRDMEPNLLARLDQMKAARKEVFTKVPPNA